MDFVGRVGVEASHEWVVEMLLRGQVKLVDVLCADDMLSEGCFILGGLVVVIVGL